MNAKTYIAWFAGTVIATLTLVSAANLTIDPYAVFGSGRVAGVNAKKTQATGFTALVKAYQIERVAPRTVLLGTSRVDISADPGHPAWPADAAPVYNYGLPESSIANLQRQLEHAISAGPVRRVLIGIEFHDFLRARAPEDGNGEIESRFDALAGRTGSSGRWLQLAKDKADAMVSLRATLDSLFTVARQRSAEAGDIGDQGLTSESPYAGVARSDGMYTLFRQKDGQIAQARQIAAGRLAGQNVETFVELPRLQALIEHCRVKGIELTLFIPPYHAHYLEIVDATGLWGRFEALKVKLAALVASQRAQHPESKIRLWDFAAHDEYADEAVPPKGDRNHVMQWYWEPVHFKKALGDLLLARMLGSDSRALGVELTPDNVAARLADGRRMRESYRLRRPDEVRELQALVRVDGRLLAAPQVQP